MSSFVLKNHKMAAILALMLAVSLTGRVLAQTGPIKGDLYVVSVGVNNPTYGNKPLNNAANDAEAEARFWATQGGKLYKQVHVAPTLTNERATSQAILASLDRLVETAHPSDTVVVALSGHGGVNPQTGQYAFCAYDRLVYSADLRQRIEALAKKDVRVVVILDTCHAGAIGIHGNNIIVLAACTAQENASDGLKNGLYTQTLLAGLKGAADANKDGIVTLAELGLYVATEMEKVSGVQCPSIGVAANVRSNLPLAETNPAAANPGSGGGTGPILPPR